MPGPPLPLRHRRYPRPPALRRRIQPQQMRRREGPAYPRHAFSPTMPPSAAALHSRQLLRRAARPRLGWRLRPGLRPAATVRGDGGISGGGEGTRRVSGAAAAGGGDAVGGGHKLCEHRPARGGPAQPQPVRGRRGVGEGVGEELAAGAAVAGGVERGEVRGEPDGGVVVVGRDDPDAPPRLGGGGRSVTVRSVMGRAGKFKQSAISEVRR
jgi:hypothetical protein